jgi:hypothetical protein
LCPVFSGNYSAISGRCCIGFFAVFLPLASNQNVKLIRNSSDAHHFLQQISAVMAGSIFVEGDSITRWSTRKKEKEVIGHLVKGEDVLHCVIPPGNKQVICL